MDRLVALGKGCLAAACLLAVACAHSPAAQSPTALGYQASVAPVDAGPPDCRALFARIDGSEASDALQAGTWLDAPERMVESRRMRALHARADALGCRPPRI